MNKDYNKKIYIFRIKNKLIAKIIDFNRINDYTICSSTLTSYQRGYTLAGIHASFFPILRCK